MNDIDEAYASWDADEKRKRNAVIEECAVALERLASEGCSVSEPVIATIRALKGS